MRSGACSPRPHRLDAGPPGPPPVHALVLALLVPFLTAALPSAVLAVDRTVCPFGCDFTTIQEAINVSSSGDVIRLTDDDPHVEDDILVFTSVEVRGQHSQLTTIQAADHQQAATDRVFEVLAGVTLTLRDVTVRFGSTPDDGGAILNRGRLRLFDSWVSHSRGYRGGGVFNEGELTCENCIIVHNIARVSGGGIFNASGSELTAVDCELSFNEAEDDDLQPARGGNLTNYGTASLAHCRVRSGLVVSTDLEGAQGGGIYSSGDLLLERVTLSSNQSYTSLSEGGGLHVAAGEATLLRSYIGLNVAEGDGGGLFLAEGAELVASDLVVAENEGQYGGGIASKGTLTLTNASLAGNRAYAGGALRMTGGSAKLRNATLSGNRSTGDGGGVDLAAGFVDISSSTIVANIADDDGNGDGDGGGLRVSSTCIGPGPCQLPTARLHNTILGLNLDQTGDPASRGLDVVAHDCHGDIVSEGYNVLQNVGTGSFAICEATGDLTGVVFGQNPLVTELQDNGGPTIGRNGLPPATHAPTSFSPARDTGDPAGCTALDGTPLPLDQRHAPRVGVCDIGAVEFGSEAPTALIFQDSFESGDVSAW